MRNFLLFVIILLHFIFSHSLRTVSYNIHNSQYLFKVYPSHTKHSITYSNTRRNTSSSETKVNTVPLNEDKSITKQNPWSSSFLILNFVAILWGTQHLFIKDAVDHYPSPSLVNFSRFLLSSLFFAPGAYSAILTRDIALTEAGAELGFYSFLGFAFQAIGLQTTSPSRSAFLLYLNVKFVPLFAALLYGRKISGRIWASALTALIGTYFLSTDGGLNTVGDLWCVAAAAASAMFILKLGTHSNSFEPAKLTGISSVTATVLCGIWMMGDLLFHSYNDHLPLLQLINEWTDSLISDPIPPLYLGLVITVLCGYLQTIGQRGYPAERAAIIYSLDPVYAAIFSWLIQGQGLSERGWLGGVLVLGGVWLSSSDKNELTKWEDLND